jgi:hypothetical protein
MIIIVSDIRHTDKFTVDIKTLLHPLPFIDPQRNHTNSCTHGPSLNSSVDTSLAPTLTPCLTFLLLLSHPIQHPNSPAVVASAGIYLG